MIDEVDLKMLNILQRDARASNVEIARAVGLAPSATLERIRKLEQRGLIRGYEARLDSAALGRGQVAFVFVRTNERAGALAARGVNTVIGDLGNSESYRKAAEHFDAYVLTAFDRTGHGVDVDRSALDMFLRLAADSAQERPRADRKSTRLNSSHSAKSRMPSSA